MEAYTTRLCFLSFSLFLLSFLLCFISSDGLYINEPQTRSGKVKRFTTNRMKNSCDHFTTEFLQQNLPANGVKNVFFSPFGIQTCFAMLLKGASGETKSEMMKALKLDMYTVDSELHSQFKEVCVLEII